MVGIRGRKRRAGRQHGHGLRPPERRLPQAQELRQPCCHSPDLHRSPVGIPGTGGGPMTPDRNQLRRALPTAALCALLSKGLHRPKHRGLQRPLRPDGAPVDAPQGGISETGAGSGRAALHHAALRPVGGNLGGIQERVPMAHRGEGPRDGGTPARPGKGRHEPRQDGADAPQVHGVARYRKNLK